MIHLFDQFYLDADDTQFILIEWDGKVQTFKDGRTKNEYNSRRFYSKFENVLEKLAIIYQRRAIEESKTLEELGKRFDETKKLIESIGTRMWPTFQDAYQGVPEAHQGVEVDSDI